MKASNRRKRQAGFTIVEIMVVVVIIGLLATVVAANVFGDVDKANLNKVKADFQGILEACDRYRLSFHDYPQELNSLVEPEEGQPFLKELPTDPWKSEYRLEGLSEKGYPMLICAGKDREYGTDDDITTENYRSLTQLPGTEANK
ncbi:MAG: type II secretion system protein GspG [Planctomycetota bacterium]